MPKKVRVPREWWERHFTLERIPPGTPGFTAHELENNIVMQVCGRADCHCYEEAKGRGKLYDERLTLAKVVYAVCRVTFPGAFSSPKSMSTSVVQKIARWKKTQRSKRQTSRTETPPVEISPLQNGQGWTSAVENLLAHGATEVTIDTKTGRVSGTKFR